MTRLTVRQALAQARELGLAYNDSRYWLCHLLQVDRAWLISHDDDELPPCSAAAYLDGCRRLASGEPMAYLTGEREFFGLCLKVAPGVLIPRPDTEVLVEWALELLAEHLRLAADDKADSAVKPASAPQVIDLGTGSGAIALAVAARCPQARVLATDRSQAALAQASANADRLKLALDFASGDWWQAAGCSRFHLALSNPPYIAGGDPHLAALRHEPLEALTPGDDGLSDLAALVAQAGEHLYPGGWLLLEHGWDQAAAVRQMLANAGFSRISSRRDLSGHERCTGGRLDF